MLHVVVLQVESGCGRVWTGMPEIAEPVLTVPDAH